MNEWSYSLVLAFLWGLLLGSIYFAGLWFSVRRLLFFKRAALWISISYLLRNLVVLAGFYLTMNGQWQDLTMSLTGFLLVRVVLVKRAGKQIRRLS